MNETKTSLARKLTNKKSIKTNKQLVLVTYYKYQLHATYVFKYSQISFIPFDGPTNNLAMAKSVPDLFTERFSCENRFSIAFQLSNSKMVLCHLMKIHGVKRKLEIRFNS